MKIDKRYKEAMNHLPFDENLEEKTQRALNATVRKEKVPYAERENIGKDKNRKKRGWNVFVRYRKPLMAGISMLAVACFIIAIVPTAIKLPSNVSKKTEQIESTKMPIEDVPQNKTVELESDVAASEQHLPLAQEAAVDVAFMDSTASFAAPESFVVPDWNTEEYNFIKENGFISASASPLSTFSADVDTGSYAKLRSTILAGRDVPVDSVRIEELLNYFTYDYKKPNSGEPFGVTTELAACPWNPEALLLQIGLQAEEIDSTNIPAQNLVFLIDVSGSMDDPNKLPLVKRAFLLLLEELDPKDTVSIVTYASGDRVVLSGVSASNKTAIMEAIENLTAGGGTAGAAGIQTAYELAEKYFNKEGNNRVILATDGDLNIGISDEGSLTRLIEEKRDSGVFLSVLGFGYGNYKDNKLEALADHGNGNYTYIDTIYEARKALVEEIGGTFLTMAKDVKIQVDFNPEKVKGYRLIGYENRLLDAGDFADDTKDGGEVGSGHQVTALYEIIPVGSGVDINAPQSKYQTKTNTGENESEWLTVNIRSKEPTGDESRLFSYPVEGIAAMEMSDNMKFASSVAEFGMLLRDSEYKGKANYTQILERLRNTQSVNGNTYKEEFKYLVTISSRSAELNESEK